MFLKVTFQGFPPFFRSLDRDRLDITKVWQYHTSDCLRMHWRLGENKGGKCCCRIWSSDPVQKTRHALRGLQSSQRSLIRESRVPVRDSHNTSWTAPTHVNPHARVHVLGNTLMHARTHKEETFSAIWWKGSTNKRLLWLFFSVVLKSSCDMGSEFTVGTLFPSPHLHPLCLSCSGFTHLDNFWRSARMS